MTDGTKGAASGTETPAGGDALPSAADIMAFDPFGPANDTPAGEVVPAGDTPAPKPAEEPSKQGAPAAATPPLKAGEQPPVDPAKATPSAADPNAPKPAPATPAPAPQPQAADLAELIRQQTETIQAALQTPKGPAEPAAPKPPKYELGIPPQVLNALRSEDPAEFAGGMHAVINGIANRIWDDVNTHVQEFVRQSVPAMISSAQDSRSTQEQVATDFYGTHPNLQNPVLKPLIQNVGLQVVQQRQSQGKPIAWNAELRDEIAETIYASLPQLRPAAAQAPAAPNGSAAPAPKPPFASGGGVRPAPAAPTDEFRELLGF